MPRQKTARKKVVKRNQPPSDFLALRKVPALEIERETPYPIKNRSNNLLVGVLHEPKRKSDTLIIAAHGFTASKDGLNLKYSCIELCRAGFAVYRFDFSGCGESEGRFEDATPSKLLNDLDTVVEHFRPQYTRIILYGRSMGGLLSIMVAGVRRIEGVITVAAPMHWEDRFLDRLTSQQREQLLSVGFTTIPHQTAYGEVPFILKEAFFQELKALHPLDAAKRITCPVLVVHGTADDSVPVLESQELFAALQGKKDLFLIGGADHRTSNPSHADALVARIVEWLRTRRECP